MHKILDALQSPWQDAYITPPQGRHGLSWLVIKTTGTLRLPLILTQGEQALHLQVSAQDQHLVCDLSSPISFLQQPLEAKAFIHHVETSLHAIFGERAQTQLNEHRQWILWQLLQHHLQGDWLASYTPSGWMCHHPKKLIRVPLRHRLGDGQELYGRSSVSLRPHGSLHVGLPKSAHHRLQALSNAQEFFDALDLKPPGLSTF